MQQYKEKRGYSLNRKFLVKVDLTSHTNKEWSVNFSTYPQESQICITPDYTTNSIRIYQTTSYPHKTIGLLPFKTLGIDNKTAVYSFFIILNSEEIHITNKKGVGESFPFKFNDNYGNLENLHIWNYAYQGSNRTIEEIYE
jgi:hypothetical protein